MESIIEELYYGNICLSERSVRSWSELYKAQQLAARNEASLESSMSEAQKEAFQKYVDCTAELRRMTELNAFALGFKLGLRLTAEAFIEGSGEQELVSE